jgi:hypothetical protein
MQTQIGTGILEKSVVNTGNFSQAGFNSLLSGSIVNNGNIADGVGDALRKRCGVTLTSEQTGITDAGLSGVAAPTTPGLGFNDNQSTFAPSR